MTKLAATDKVRVRMGEDTREATIINVYADGKLDVELVEEEEQPLLNDDQLADGQTVKGSASGKSKKAAKKKGRGRAADEILEEVPTDWPAGFEGIEHSSSKANEHDKTVPVWYCRDMKETIQAPTATEAEEGIVTLVQA